MMPAVADLNSIEFHDSYRSAGVQERRRQILSLAEALSRVSPRSRHALVTEFPPVLDVSAHACHKCVGLITTENL